MIRVLVEAKSAITRAGLEAIVEADARFTIAHNASRIRSLLSGAPASEADVILMDGSNSGVERLHFGVAEALTVPPVVALVESPGRAQVLRLLQSGVRAVLLRDSLPHEITAALQAACEGLAVVSPEILDMLIPASREMTEADDPAPGESLTPRESEVLALLAAGAGNKEIAAKLHISEHTAKFHVSSILSKLGATTRTQAVSRGYRQGLILI